MTKNLHLFTFAAAAALAVPVVSLPQEAPGAFKVPGTETTLTLSGYIQTFST